MGNATVRPSRLLVVSVLAVGGIIAGCYYSLILYPYIHTHRVVQRLSVRGVDMYFVNRSLGCFPQSLGYSAYSATFFIGTEAVEQPVVINCAHAKLTDEDLRDVGQLNEVLQLLLNGQPITNAGLGHLSQMDLRHLDLSDTYVGSGNCRTQRGDLGQLKPGFESLSQNAGLNHLVLSRTNVNDEDLSAIFKWATPDLVHLDSTCVTDVGMQHLSKLTSLRSLRLDNTAVTPAGLNRVSQSHLEMINVSQIELGPDGKAFLETCSNLDTVFLRKTGFTSQDCRILSKLPNLKHVHLSNNSLTDEAAEILAAMGSLETVDLRGTQITVKGIEKLSSLDWLSSIGLNGEILVDPACIARLKAIASLKRVFFSPSALIASKLEDIKQQLGPQIELVEK